MFGSTAIIEEEEEQKKKKTKKLCELETESDCYFWENAIVLLFFNDFLVFHLVTEKPLCSMQVQPTRNLCAFKQHDNRHIVQGKINGYAALKQ